LRVSSSWPPAASQTRTVLSQPAEARPGFRKFHPLIWTGVSTWLLARVRVWATTPGVVFG
jgi:hypothetical protein